MRRSVLLRPEGQAKKVAAQVRQQKRQFPVHFFGLPRSQGIRTDPSSTEIKFCGQMATGFRHDH